MTVTKQTKCEACGAEVFPAMKQADDSALLECGHPVTVWIWPCRCGAVMSQRSKNCPFCCRMKLPERL